MWCEQLPNGKYRFCERYVDPMTGKTRRVSVTMEKNTKQAERIARELLLQKMDCPGGPDITFGELCDLYLHDQEPILKPSTWKRNMYALNTLRAIIGEDTKPESPTGRYRWIRHTMPQTTLQHRPRPMNPSDRSICRMSSMTSAGRSCANRRSYP